MKDCCENSVPCKLTFHHKMSLIYLFKLSVLTFVDMSRKTKQIDLWIPFENFNVYHVFTGSVLLLSIAFPSTLVFLMTAAEIIHPNT